MPTTVWELEAKANSGQPFPFNQFKGRPMLIVNTASKCGFTPQYKGLQDLHERFGPRGLAVIAFPCDQFAHQEPGSDDEIKSFCERNYGVSFPIMSKIEVNGRGTHPVFVWLKRRAHGALGSRIKWNFTKFLVFPNGSTVRRYPPTTEPAELERDIENALTAGQAQESMAAHSS
jgi:glutathione peroxidase